MPAGLRAAFERSGINASLLAGAQRNPRVMGQAPCGQLNGYERAYRDELELQLRVGIVAAYRPHPFALRLAYRTHYRPDFLVVLVDGTTEIVEIKGHWEKDAWQKIKIAAEAYPFWRFVAIVRPKNGVFPRRIVGPPA